VHSSVKQRDAALVSAHGPARVALLTGGTDKHYAVALAAALAEHGTSVDFVASTALDCAEVHVRRITFLDLRGDQREDVAFVHKIVRILKYYVRLIVYAARCEPTVFHILWNNKFEVFDRTFLMLYYRLLGKQVVLTAHNVNAAQRDGKDSWLNRRTLRIQYRLCSAIFAHTELMKRQLVEDFGVAEDRVILIPYGINVTIPSVGLTKAQARARLGLGLDERVLLFFGQIAPYKGLEYLLDAVATLAPRDSGLRLLVAGKVKQGWDVYWDSIKERSSVVRERTIEHIRFIPDEEIEQFFTAADALVLPYTYIFQSGVLFMAYSFGLPVIATDVGSLKEYVMEGRTGFVCRPQDVADLVTTIERYFKSDLYQNLERRRDDIQQLARQRHSWTTVATITAAAYAGLGREPRVGIGATEGGRD
jgi:D-inositol-3-phosphate glycosyltransferase